MGSLDRHWSSVIAPTTSARFSRVTVARSTTVSPVPSSLARSTTTALPTRTTLMTMRPTPSDARVITTDSSPIAPGSTSVVKVGGDPFWSSVGHPW